MVKRPLAFTCLMVSWLLYLLVCIKAAPSVDYSEYEGKTFTITGKVYKKENIRQMEEPVTVLYLRLISDRNQEEEGDDPPGEKVICYLKSGQREPEMGSRIRLTGKLKAFEKASNPGQFDAYSYYQILGISYRLNQAVIHAKSKQYNVLTQSAYMVREFLSQKLSEQLPEKEAAFMQAVLLGEKGGMDKELKALYQRNGIAHVLAISGLHISMLGMGLYRLLRKCAVKMKTAAVLAAILMFFYGVMTGFSVSALRAILMFALQMLGVLLKRSYDMLTGLGMAAIIILLAQPLYLHHSGFLFSFGCLLGIGLLLPALTISETESGDKTYPILQGLSGSLGMAVITLPIYLWFYYQFPLYSIFLNLLVIPLMSLLMAAGLLLLLGQIIFPPAVMPFVSLIRGILWVYEYACEICEKLPGNLLTLGRPRGWQVAVYLLLLLLIIILKKRTKLIVRWGIVAIALFLLTLPGGKGLEITFLDVGQGDCIYIEYDDQVHYLIDGGSSSVSNVGEYRILPFLKYQGASKLDAVFVTHPDEDHCNGIKELLCQGKEEGIQIQTLVLPDIAESAKNEGYQALEELAGEEGISTAYMSCGQRIQKGKLTITCLHPQAGDFFSEANEFSTVLWLTYGNFCAMLTGDLEGDGEKQVLHLLQEESGQQMLRTEGDWGSAKAVTVLKAAHHGSRGSTSDDFLELLPPVFTVISCGANNPYGHPHRELLERLEEHNSSVFVTSERGAVTFATDGKRVRVSAFRDK